jgi:hypothetical protein
MTGCDECPMQENPYARTRHTITARGTQYFDFCLFLLAFSFFLISLQ